MFRVYLYLCLLGEENGNKNEKEEELLSWTTRAKRASPLLSLVYSHPYSVDKKLFLPRETDRYNNIPPPPVLDIFGRGRDREWI